MKALNRRTLLSTALALGTAVGAGCANSPSTAPGSAPSSAIRILPAQTTWGPAPAQVPVTEGIAALPDGARLWYWDTGGSGEPVVLMHAYSGSAAFWEYQQPVLAKAGYRVIAYSRRGHYKSDPPNPDNPGSGAGDLHELVQHLGLDRFHLVSTAAGGFIAMDYAVSYQDRLLSLVVANSLSGISEPAFGAVTQALLPKVFNQTPADFREIGPSYRAGYRPGVERWMALHETAGKGGMQRTLNKLTWSAVETLRVPTLLVTGGADLYMPPSRVRELAKHIPGSEVAIFNEAGHSTYWEQPEAFNAELLRFLGKHRKGG